MRGIKTAISPLLSCYRERWFVPGCGIGTQAVAALCVRSSTFSACHNNRLDRGQLFTATRSPANPRWQQSLLTAMVLSVLLSEFWSLTSAGGSSKAYHAGALLLHVAASGAETTGAERQSYQHHLSQKKVDKEAADATMQDDLVRSPQLHGGGTRKTAFNEEDMIEKIISLEGESPLDVISEDITGAAAGKEKETEQHFPDKIDLWAHSLTDSVGTEAFDLPAALPISTYSLSSPATLYSESAFPPATASVANSVSASPVVPLGVGAYLSGNFGSLASIAVPSLLTGPFASFPLFSTVVERKKFDGRSCTAATGCSSSSSRTSSTGSSSSSSSNSSSSSGCGGVPCALDMFSLLDSTNAIEWPLTPSVVLHGIGKTVDKVVKGFALGTAQVLPNIKRNVIISYKGYKPFRLLETLQQRNHFLEHLSSFFTSLQPLRSIYLRHLGMEIFELPDVLGIADFIKAALGLRQYVEHVYEDQELTDFDPESASSIITQDEDSLPRPATAAAVPVREVRHRQTKKTSSIKKQKHRAHSPPGGIYVTDVSAGALDAVGEATDGESFESSDGHLTKAVGNPGKLQSQPDKREDKAVRQEDVFKATEARPAPPRRLEVMPNDPYTWRQWSISDNGRFRWGTEAPKAWEIWTGASLPESITVAVIDSGVNYQHAELRQMIWTNPDEICYNGIDDDRNGLVDDCIGWDFINGDNDPDDDNGHGTASAGIIAAEPNNNVGMAGICWKCKIMILKALNKEIKGTVSSFARAIDYALGKGVKISNNSYGGRGSNFHGLEQAVKRARAAGMIFVAAAGNYYGNNDNDRDPVYPASYPLDNIISVAAITRAGTLANFSSYGKTQVDIAAPGAQILSTSLNETYRTLDGTSFAVPFVTGAVALVWSRFPHLSYQEVIARILKNAKPNPHLKGYIATSGVLDLWKALTDGADVPPPPLPSGMSPYPQPPPVGQPLRQAFFCGNVVCHPVATCVISAEGPLCQCPTGYEGNGVDCRDIDECSFSPCGPASVCKNLPGSFECACRDGFRQVDDACVDIDECAEGVVSAERRNKRRACPAVAFCQNFSGSFDCLCPPRSLWNGKSGTDGQCLTLNVPLTGPCVNNGGCGINALCQASNGAWYHRRICTCVEGYEKYGLHPQSPVHLQQIQVLGDGKGVCIRKGLLELEVSRYFSVREFFLWTKPGATTSQQSSDNTGSSGSHANAGQTRSVEALQVAGLPTSASPARLTAADTLAIDTPGGVTLPEGRPNSSPLQAERIYLPEQMSGSEHAAVEFFPMSGPPITSSSMLGNTTSAAVEESKSTRLASDIVGTFHAATGWLRPRGTTVIALNQAPACFLGICLLGGTEASGSRTVTLEGSALGT